MSYRKINKEHWINTEINTVFKTNLIRDIHGKAFNFLDRKQDFLNGKYGLKYYLDFFDRTEIYKNEYLHNTEIIISDLMGDLKEKKVLVLGAGPSSDEVDWQNNYDFIVTSNNYYKKFKKDPYLITFTPYMPLEDEGLQDFLNNSNCLIGIEPEFHKTQEQKKINKFWKKYKERVVFYHTRYCSAIGVSTRQAVLAVLCGAKEVHLCGMDLFKDSESTVHSFETKKDLPRWRKQHGLEFQNRQVLAFWEYLSKIAKEQDCVIKNIAEDLDYNCMSFITKKGMIK